MLYWAFLYGVITFCVRLFGLCPVVDLGEGGHGYDIEEWRLESSLS